MPEQKKLFIFLVGVAVIISSIFGAGAGLFAVRSEPTQRLLESVFGVAPQDSELAPATISVSEQSAVIDAVKKAVTRK